LKKSYVEGVKSCFEEKAKKKRMCEGNFSRDMNFNHEYLSNKFHWRIQMKSFILLKKERKRREE
jgi:hypothetical protein